MQNRLRKVRVASVCFASIFKLVLWSLSMCSHVLQAVFKAQDKRDVAINMLLCIYVYIYNYVLYFSVAQSCPTLQPNGLQNTRLPCPSLSPRACSDSSPLSQWCHPTIIILCHPLLLQSFPASGSFPMSQFFISGGQSIGDSASPSVLPMNIQGWFPLEWTGLISLQAKGLSRVFFNTKIQKHQFFSAQPTLWSNTYIHTWPQEKPYPWLDGS